MKLKLLLFFRRSHSCQSQNDEKHDPAFGLVVTKMREEGIFLAATQLRRLVYQSEHSDVGADREFRSARADAHTNYSLMGWKEISCPIIYEPKRCRP